jgi:hypothetical protein
MPPLWLMINFFHQEIANLGLQPRINTWTSGHQPSNTHLIIDIKKIHMYNICVEKIVSAYHNQLLTAIYFGYDN